MLCVGESFEGMLKTKEIGIHVGESESGREGLGLGTSCFLKCVYMYSVNKLVNKAALVVCYVAAPT